MTYSDKIENAMQEIADYIISSEYQLAADKMKEFDNFDDWANYILSRTVYGSANIVLFRNASDSSMMNDLRQMWNDNHKTVFSPSH